MFHHQDGISEIIAHFIGHFHMGIEDMRLREEYLPGSALTSLIDEQEQASLKQSLFHHGLEFGKFIPGVAYTAPQAAIAASDVKSQVHFEPVLVSVPDLDTAPDMLRLQPDAAPPRTGKHSAWRSSGLDRVYGPSARFAAR